MRDIIIDSHEAFARAIKTNNGRNMIPTYAKRRGFSQRKVYRMCNGETKNPVKEIEEVFEEKIPPELDPEPILRYLCFKYGYVIAEVPITLKEHEASLKQLRKEMKGQMYLKGFDVDKEKTVTQSKRGRK